MTLMSWMTRDNNSKRHMAVKKDSMAQRHVRNGYMKHFVKLKTIINFFKIHF